MKNKCKYTLSGKHIWSNSIESGEYTVCTKCSSKECSDVENIFYAKCGACGIVDDTKDL